MDDLETVTPASVDSSADANRPARGTAWSRDTVVDERFRVLDVFGGPGVTGMGVVYILEDGAGRTFAAKTFQYQYARDLRLVERFLREARAWLLTGFHPNIVHAYFVDIIDGMPLLFMEFVPEDAHGGRSLADRIRRGALSVEDAIRFGIQCCDGMAHATAAVPGLVHRDLKPENLLLTPDDRLKITDFGLVRWSLMTESAQPPDDEGHEWAFATPNDPAITQAGTVMGTPSYMAPEQFVSADEVSERTDIYAFGCCLYEAIAGSRVFTLDGVPRGELMPHMRQQHLYESPAPLRLRAPACPAALSDVVMRCLRKDADERWARFEELGLVLREIQQASTGRTIPPAIPLHPEPYQAAEQSRSLTLLEGYGQAVRHRSLRENHSLSPYAFHLALASYFRVQGESAEEQRQLEKAQRAAGDAAGYETVRRLAELALQRGAIDEAGRLITGFLERYPGGGDHVLEPRIAWMLARGDWAEAFELLQAEPEGFRRDQLFARYCRVAGEDEALVKLLQRHCDAAVERLCRAVQSLRPGDVSGWDQDRDPEALRRTLELLAPDFDASPLEHGDRAVWPRLDGYPDFAADMAILSQVCGDLASLEGWVDEADQTRLRTCAELLGYPERYVRYLDRDERWIWAQ